MHTVYIELTHRRKVYLHTNHATETRLPAGKAGALAWRFVLGEVARALYRSALISFPPAPNGTFGRVLLFFIKEEK
jgi:hypothetical protein